MKCKASITIVKRRGDNGSPCLSPLLSLNSSVGDPLTRMEVSSYKECPSPNFSTWKGNPYGA
ncbi:hypothetical protein HanHA89_Chr00c02g0733061 [Helianthus annuus]|nr:hypothetical protein HanHA89_Chr00c02g0733061 [Helianthus annuus]